MTVTYKIDIRCKQLNSEYGDLVNSYCKECCTSDAKFIATIGEEDLVLGNDFITNLLSLMADVVYNGGNCIELELPDFCNYKPKMRITIIP